MATDMGRHHQQKWPDIPLHCTAAPVLAGVKVDWKNPEASLTHTITFTSNASRSAVQS